MSVTLSTQATFGKSLSELFLGDMGLEHWWKAGRCRERSSPALGFRTRCLTSGSRVSSPRITISEHSMQYLSVPLVHCRSAERAQPGYHLFILVDHHNCCRTK